MFPQWKVEEMTVEPALGHSLSGRYARGVLRRGQQVWAVIGSGDQEDLSAAEDILTYGVIWLDLLRRREQERVVTGLKIFVPRNRAETLLHRIAWLDPEAAQWEMFEAGDAEESGAEFRRCDPADFGNLKTLLGPAEALRRAPSNAQWGDRIEAISPDVLRHSGGDGFCYWAVQGLSVARESTRGVVFGVAQSETPLSDETFGEFAQMVRKLLRLRHPDSPDRLHPFYRLWPERWMQSLLARQIQSLGYDLVAGELYEQVPAVSGSERGVMDLLAVDSSGRLVVVELKASENIHLPFQALDYWMRVHWHHQRGEFERERYFAGRSLRPSPPLLLLVSPALQIHPACEIVLRYFSKAIETVQIGMNENWREHWQVVFRSGR
jgi:hypothetical protein